MVISNGSKRIYKWDNMKAFLILLVVVGHLIDRASWKSDLLIRINYWIYMFHMPAFVFVSGLFSKKNINQKRFDKIFRFLQWYFILKIILFISTLMSLHVASFSFLTESGLPWYCFAIFAFQLITVFVAKYDKFLVVGMAILIGCLAGYDTGLGDFLCSSRVLTFFPFFYMGYLIDFKKLSLRLNSLKMKISALIILLFSFLIVYFKLYQSFLTTGFFTGRNPYVNISNIVGLYGGVFRFFYYIGVFFMIFSIVALTTNKSTILTKFGECSLVIYMLHIPIVRILNDKFYLDELIKSIGIPQSITILIISVFICFICSTKIVEKTMKKVLYFDIAKVKIEQQYFEQIILNKLKKIQ